VADHREHVLVTGIRSATDAPQVHLVRFPHVGAIDGGADVPGVPASPSHITWVVAEAVVVVPNRNDRRAAHIPEGAVQLGLQTVDD
jgi:hypothetical protein